MSLVREPLWQGGLCFGEAACWKAGGLSLLNVLCFDGTEQVGVDQGRCPSSGDDFDSHLKAQVQVVGTGRSVHTTLSNCEPAEDQTEEYRSLLNFSASPDIVNHPVNPWNPVELFP